MNDWLINIQDMFHVVFKESGAADFTSSINNRVPDVCEPAGCFIVNWQIELDH